MFEYCKQYINAKKPTTFIPENVATLKTRFTDLRPLHQEVIEVQWHVRTGSPRHEHKEAWLATASPA
eukprot:9927192-Alexandrium_andersonii.AAC.1